MLNEWEQQVRANNVASHENVVTTLKEAQIFIAENKGDFDQVLVILSRENQGDGILFTWINGGFRFSKLIFLFQYITHEFLNIIKGESHE